ncbi:MAG: NAD(P)-binding domain-containing protein [Acidobacteria bacterium]|nr:NAD(P)-binding domain-containing protein [Acidobacteriota bacterium]
METLLAFSIGFTVTIFFVWRYMKRMKHAPQDRVVVKSVVCRPCPRCSKDVPQGSEFCPGCGAALAIWNIHRSSVKDAGAASGDKGRPRPVINATLCIGCGSCVDACPETGTLALKGGKAILAFPERCQGHAKCVDVCPTSGVQVAYGNALQTLRVPMVHENFETNVPGVFIAGELGGMGLIKTAINEGRIAVERIRARLEQAGIQRTPMACHDGHSAPPDNDPPNGEPFDVAIIGAGPAGLSASLSAKELGIRYITLEQGEVAATIRNYPRHKFLMAEPIDIPLYGSLYVSDSTKEALLSIWETIIANTGVRIRTNQRVSAIRRDPDTQLFQVTTGDSSFEARFVLLAIGKRGVPRKLNVPGEEMSKVSYRLIEANDYENHDLLVVGGGDSAIEAALALSKHCRNRVTLSYRSGSFDRARERNRDALLQAENDGLLYIMRKSNVVRIFQQSVILSQNGEEIELPNDFVFILAGGESPEDFLRKTGVEIVEKVISQ